jgi:uncharacterized OB-fold protein
MVYHKPLPRPNPDTRSFWDGCLKHELRFQQCISCGHVRWPASIICPTCYSKEVAWTRSGGKGTIYTYSVYHQAFHPSFEKDIPYVTAIIALAEGPHILSNIVGCAPDEIYCGMPVEVTWQDIDKAFSLPKFKPLP